MKKIIFIYIIFYAFSANAQVKKLNVYITPTENSTVVVWKDIKDYKASGSNKNCISITKNGGDGLSFSANNSNAPQCLNSATTVLLTLKNNPPVVLNIILKQKAKVIDEINFDSKTEFEKAIAEQKEDTEIVSNETTNNENTETKTEEIKVDNSKNGELKKGRNFGIPEDDLVASVNELIKKFSNALTSIGTQKSKADIYIKQAMENLFNNDAEATVQSMSSRGLGDPTPAKDYMVRIKNSPYSKIECTAEKITLVSDIRQKDDGTYTCVFSYIQGFKGYKKGLDGKQLSYQDNTGKTMEITIKMEKKRDANGDVYFDWRPFIKNVIADKLIK